MFPQVLSQIAADHAGSTSWVAIGAIGVLLAIGLNFFALVRIANGKANERQIEPTQIAAIQTELRNQTDTLNAINREMGGVSVAIDGFRADIAEVKRTTASALEGVHTRIGGISREVAAASARLDALDKRRP